MNACCRGCSFAFCARPSMVMTSLPAIALSGVLHERTALPSTRTVQAPQMPSPQQHAVVVGLQAAGLAVQTECDRALHAVRPIRGMIFRRARRSAGTREEFDLNRAISQYWISGRTDLYGAARYRRDVDASCRLPSRHSRYRSSGAPPRLPFIESRASAAL